MITCPPNKANRVTQIEALAKVPIVKSPHRPSGKNWKGTKHSNLVKALWEEMDKREWSHEGLMCWVSNDQCDAVCTMQLIIPHLKLPPKVELSLGIYNSNAQRRSFELVIGVTEGVHHVVLGHITTRKRHTHGTNLEKLTSKALDLFHKRAKHKLKRVRDMRKQMLTREDFDRILLAAMRAGIIPWTYGEGFNKAVEEAFADGSISMWKLLCLYSDTAKRSPPHKQMDLMLEFMTVATKPREEITNGEEIEKV